MKKILHVVGARPQFIKLSPVANNLRLNFEQIIVHTGQHYDETMSDIFFKDLNIPPPHYNLHVGSLSACQQIGKMLIGLEEVFEIEKPDCVIVYGDTNSTCAAAIASVKLGIKLAHIEAGLREFNKYIPEESNKLVTDILADFYFCPTQNAVDILLSMGIKDHVYNIGDVMIDLIANRLSDIESNIAILKKYNLTKKNYAFMTCHRAANTDNPENLKIILKAVSYFKETVVFPVHPRTLKVITQNGLEKYLSKNMLLIEPLGYIDSQTLIRFARFVYTDSGGVTKEAYFHHTPGILLDTQTEWIETIHEGWNQQAGPNLLNIHKAYDKLAIPPINTNCLGDGHASEKINNILQKELNRKN